MKMKLILIMLAVNAMLSSCISISLSQQKTKLQVVTDINVDFHQLRVIISHLIIVWLCVLAVLQKPSNAGRSGAYKSSSHKTYCRKVRTVTMSLIPVQPGHKTCMCMKFK